VTTAETAVRTQVAGLTALVVTNQSAVTEWVRRYFGSWWRAERESLGTGVADVHVVAQVDDNRFAGC
jgi:hypothetical protein